MCLFCLLAYVVIEYATNIAGEVSNDVGQGVNRNNRSPDKIWYTLFKPSFLSHPTKTYVGTLGVQPQLWIEGQKFVFR